MMKKITTYILILLANIILLAHAVMPHHHHQLQFCIESTHCHHQNNPLNTSHEHDGENDTDCILKQLIIFPSTQYKLECKFIDLNIFHLLHGLNAVELNKEFQLFAESLVNEIESPNVNLSYPLLLTTSTGLRAPPAV